MADDEHWVLEGGIEQALIETHHLANISNLPEAELARQRLVAAQSADSLTRTRDHLADASEFLELARLARRDCAAGFAQARDLVAMAEAALRFERPVPLAADPATLLRDGPKSRRRRTLQELRRETAVSSFEQLKYDVALEEAFEEIRCRVIDADGDPFPHLPADPVTGSRADPAAGNGDDQAAGNGDDPASEATGEEVTAEMGSDGQSPPDTEATMSQPVSREIGVEEALRLASLEVDIQRSLMRASASAAGADSEFQFVSTEELASREESRAEES